MLEAKHTPGPLHAEDRGVDGEWLVRDEATGAVTAVVCGDDGHPERALADPLPAEANAALYAGAPELLDALRLFFQVNDAGIERGTTLGEQLTIAGFFTDARYAIAKAEAGGDFDV